MDVYVTMNIDEIFPFGGVMYKKKRTFGLSCFIVYIMVYCSLSAGYCSRYSSSIRLKMANI